MSAQRSLFQFQKYPDEPGYKVTGPSKDAAAQMVSKAGTIRSLCYNAIKARPMTADEVAAAIGETAFTCRPRLSELLKMGMITDSGARRQNASGKSATVWKAI